MTTTIQPAVSRDLAAARRRPRPRGPLHRGSDAETSTPSCAALRPALWRPAPAPPRPAGRRPRGVPPAPAARRTRRALLPGRARLAARPGHADPRPPRVVRRRDPQGAEHEERYRLRPDGASSRPATPSPPGRRGRPAATRRHPPRPQHRRRPGDLAARLRRRPERRRHQHPPDLPCRLRVGPRASRCPGHGCLLRQLPGARRRSSYLCHPQMVLIGGRRESSVAGKSHRLATPCAIAGIFGARGLQWMERLTAVLTTAWG